jgi:hypothetical protein
VRRDWDWQTGAEKHYKLALFRLQQRLEMFSLDTNAFMSLKSSMETKRKFENIILKL